jgi:hypothetical protein
MLIFARFDPADPHPLARVWAKSWEANGWTVKLIIPSEDSRAMERRAGRRKHRLSTFNDINFSQSPKAPIRRAKLGTRSWLTAGIVEFPAGSTEETVRNSGRKWD